MATKQQELIAEYTDDTAALIKAILEGGGSLDGESAASIAYEIMGQTDIAVIFGSRKAMSTSDFIGLPFTIKAVTWRPSDISGTGPSVFAVLHVRVKGESDTRVLTTGSRNVLAQLLTGLKAVKAKATKLPMMTVRFTETAGKNTVYWLESVTDDMIGTDGKVF